MTYQVQELTENFFSYIYNIRRDLLIADKLDFIGNVDETAIYYENIYRTIISKIGEKSVRVRTFGKDKLRISAKLRILANGMKISPLLIFGDKMKDLRKKVYSLRYMA